MCDIPHRIINHSLYHHCKTRRRMNVESSRMNKNIQQNISFKKGNNQNASSNKAKTLDGWQAVTLRPDRRNKEHHINELIRRHTLSGFHMKDIQSKLDNYRNLLEKVRNRFSSFCLT